MSWVMPCRYGVAGQSGVWNRRHCVHEESTSYVKQQHVRGDPSILPNQHNLYTTIIQFTPQEATDTPTP
jgi:hypothetical protein